MKPDGIFLSNGPGDPEALGDIHTEINSLLGKIPVFGICLGHQVLAIIRLQSTSLIALCTILFSFHYGFGAPTKGRLEDPVKVNAKTEAVINSALSYRRLIRI